MVSIRKANLQDVYEMVSIDEECFGKNKYDKDYWEYLLYTSEIYVAEDTKNKIIGIISIMNISNDSKEISHAIKSFMKKFNIINSYLIVSICVSSLHRSSGIGSKLLKEVLNQKKHIVFLNVRESNDKAIKFYKKHGFHKAKYIDKNFYNYPKENGLLMYYGKLL